MALIPGGSIEHWRAAWAWTKQRGGPGLTVRRFRRTFRLESAPQQFESGGRIALPD